MRREHQKSLHLHRAIARKVAQDYSGEVAKARDFLERHRTTYSPIPWWWREWDAVLTEYSRRDLIRLLTDPSDYAIELRSSTPFTRALSIAERTAVLSEFSRRNVGSTAA